MNEKFFELKKGHIGIVEKAQETRSDSDIYAYITLCDCTIAVLHKSGCVLECRETPTSQVTI